MLQKGQKYKHYKGNEYVVVCLAIDESTEKPVVVYQDLQAPEKIWVRAVEVFSEEVDVQGEKFPRFKYIGE